MTEKARFRVGYIDPPMYPSFVETLEGSDQVELLRLGDRTLSPDAVRERLKTCEGYYVTANRDELSKHLHVNADLIATLPNLAVVATYGAGYDTVNVPACTVAGIAVVNQAGGNARAVAEHAVAMMLTLLKRIPEAHSAMRAGTVAPRERFIGRELFGRTVGIVGLGHIGRCTAGILTAIGCKVLAVDPYVRAADGAWQAVEKVDIAELLARSDVVTLHCPLTPETRGLFGADNFAAMRHGAIFINTSRGSTYDEAALLNALQTGHLGGAGLDVWENEPPAADHPLLSQPAVIASPHTAGVTHESRNRVALLAAQVFLEAAAGRMPARCLNPQVEAMLLKRLHA